MRLALETVFKPIAKQFKPQVLIRNGGADPHHLDELAQLSLSYDGLHDIGDTVRTTSKDLGCGVVDLLCGGYNPGTEEKGLYSIFSGLIGIEAKFKEESPVTESERVQRKTESMLKELIAILRDYWNL